MEFFYINFFQYIDIHKLKIWNQSNEKKDNLKHLKNSCNQCFYNAKGFTLYLVIYKKF